jgi:hypothetical protein
MNEMVKFQTPWGEVELYVLPDTAGQYNTPDAGWYWNTPDAEDNDYDAVGPFQTAEEAFEDAVFYRLASAGNRPGRPDKETKWATYLLAKGTHPGPVT